MSIWTVTLTVQKNGPKSSSAQLSKGSNTTTPAILTASYLPLHLTEPQIEPSRPKSADKMANPSGSVVIRSKKSESTETLTTLSRRWAPHHQINTSLQKLLAKLAFSSQCEIVCNVTDKERMERTTIITSNRRNSLALVSITPLTLSDIKTLTQCLWHLSRMGFQRRLTDSTPQPNIRFSHHQIHTALNWR